MAAQKPRFGGVLYSMDDCKQIYTANMAAKTQAGDGGFSESIFESESETNIHFGSQNTKSKQSSVSSSSQSGSHKQIRVDDPQVDTIPVSFQQRSHLDNSEVCHNVASGANTCHRPDNDHVQQLMRVFEKLDIETQPKPYTRCTVQNGPICSSRAEPQSETSGAASSGESLSTEEKCVVYCKNLFLKDHRGQFYIFVCPEDYSADLKMLKQRLNAHRNLSFGDSETLHTVLQINPGEVTPLAVMHESAKSVRVAVHSILTEAGAAVKFAFHPLCGHLQVELSYPEFKSFIEYFGKTVEIVSEETLGKTHETSNKHGTSPTDKPKHGLGSKQAMSKNKKQHSIVNIQGFEETPISEAQPERSFQDASSEDVRNPYLGVFRHGLVTSSRRRKKNSELAQAKGTEITIHAEVHTSTDFNQLFIKSPSQMNIEETSLGTFKKSICSESAVAEIGSSGDNYDEQFTCITFEEGKNSERSPTEIVLSGGENIHTVSGEKGIELKMAEEPERDKLRKRPFLNYLSRKGKLRSFVKTKAPVDTYAVTTSGSVIQHGVETLVGDKGDSSKSRYSNRRDDLTSEVHEFETSRPLGESCRTDSPTRSFERKPSNYKRLQDPLESNDITITIGGNAAQESILSESRTEQTLETKLEIVERFYSSLRDSGSNYDEIDLSNDGDSWAIGPSVGCCCFLMTDKGGSFFFVVSHELYELDFGRLKAALRPKKKLIVAQPADIITVLGADPMRVSPFAVLTMKDPQTQVYTTRKIMAPNLVLCIQHPFAQARRILMTFDELRKYFEFLGVTVGSVEERPWNPRFNGPFSQFDNPEKGSAPANSCDTKSQISTEKDRQTSLSDQNTTEESQKNLLSTFCTPVGICQFLSAPLRILAQSTYPFFTYDYFIKTEPVTNNPIACDGTPVDTPLSQTTQDIIQTQNHDFVEVHLFAPSHLKHVPLPMTTEYLENHLLSFGVTFDLNKKHYSGVARDSLDQDKDRAIIERCAIMHLTNGSGHNFLILGSRDDFPMSVKRFCRRSRIREHLDIRIDPQNKSDSHILFDVAPRMLPFALAFAELRTLIWDRFRFLPSAWDAKDATSKARDSDALTPFGGSVGRTMCSGVTMALTTTLYIDPGTVMEFTVGRESSKLRMTSSEFERYCREVGFEVMYY